MKRIAITAIALMTVLTVLAVSSSAAGKLFPEKIGYTVYIKGKAVGGTNIEVTEADGLVTFRSHTFQEWQDYGMALDCKTVFDAETYVVKSFEYAGTKNGEEIAGTFEPVGDVIRGTQATSAGEFTNARQTTLPMTLFFEDYVVDHEILLCLVHAQSEEVLGNYGVFLPSSFTMTTGAVLRVGKLAVESENKEAICTRLTVEFQGSSGYTIFYDPERKLPVYMAFPSAYTEIFLNEFYDDKPITLYKTEASDQE